MNLLADSLFFRINEINKMGFFLLEFSPILKTIFNTSISK